MTGRQQASSRGVVGRHPLVEGAVAGVAAFVVGMVVLFVVARLDSDLSDRMDALTGDGSGFVDLDLGVSMVEAAIWVFADAHLVDIESTISGGGESESETVALLSEASFPELLYTVLAAAVLVAAGYLLVQWVGARTGQGGVIVGAMVTVGYLPAVVVAAALSSASRSSSVFGESVSVTVGPDLVTALVVAGLVFPLAFGALGGYLGSRRGATGQTAGGRDRL